MHEDERLPWETDGDVPWDAAAAGGSPEPEAWRGELHVDHWPEELAGPEYWLYKQLEDDEA